MQNSQAMLVLSVFSYLEKRSMKLVLKRGSNKMEPWGTPYAIWAFRLQH